MTPTGHIFFHFCISWLYLTFDVAVAATCVMPCLLRKHWSSDVERILVLPLGVFTPSRNFENQEQEATVDFKNEAALTPQFSKRLSDLNSLLPHLPRHLFSLLGKHLEKCMRERWDVRARGVRARARACVGGWSGRKEYICSSTSHLVEGGEAQHANFYRRIPPSSGGLCPGLCVSGRAGDLHDMIFFFFFLRSNIHPNSTF